MKSFTTSEWNKIIEDFVSRLNSETTKGIFYIPSNKEVMVKTPSLKQVFYQLEDVVINFRVNYWGTDSRNYWSRNQKEEIASKAIVISYDSKHSWKPFELKRITSTNPNILQSDPFLEMFFDTVKQMVESRKLDIMEVHRAKRERNPKKMNYQYWLKYLGEFGIFQKNTFHSMASNVDFEFSDSKINVRQATENQITIDNIEASIESRSNNIDSKIELLKALMESGAEIENFSIRFKCKGKIAADFIKKHKSESVPMIRWY